MEFYNGMKFYYFIGIIKIHHDNGIPSASVMVMEVYYSIGVQLNFIMATNFQDFYYMEFCY